MKLICLLPSFSLFSLFVFFLSFFFFSLSLSFYREWRREWEKLRDIEYVLGKDGNKKLNKDTKPSLYRALYRIFWRKYLIMSLLLFVHTVVLYTLQPILQGWIIDYFNISSTNSKTTTKKESIIYSFGLVVNIIVSVCIYHHVYFKSQEIGMQIRIACSSMIYRKVMIDLFDFYKR